MMIDFNKSDRYSKIQLLQKANTGFIAVTESTGARVATAVILILFGVSIGIILLAVAKSCDAVNKPVSVQLDCRDCHNRKAAMIQYFRKSGSKTPEMMAEAVLATKSPRLLAAIAVKGEKNTPYTVRNGGWKKRHAGSWQVSKKHWGEVPKDPVGQALQAEEILAELTSTMPIEKALSVYGGDSTSRYQRRVLAELVNVP